jgi:glutamate synthase (NADPH/NADH)
MVELGKVNDPQEIAELRSLIEDHRHYTGSEIADRVLSDFQNMLPMFVRVMPYEYKQVLEQEAARLKEERQRMSTIDFVRSYTASEVNLASEAIEEVFSRKGLLTAVTLSPSALRKPEQPIVDLEDSALYGDYSSTHEEVGQNARLYEIQADQRGVSPRSQACQGLERNFCPTQ